MNREQKETFINNLKSILNENNLVLVFHYRGMSMSEMTDLRVKSSPMTASLATERPPSVCSEPSVVEVASVVSSVFNTPLNVPLVALNALLLG